MKKLILSLTLLSSGLVFGQEIGNAWKEASLSGLSFRNIGPAITSGRIADIAVHPNNSSTYYLAMASGGVWKTENNGTTYSPIFDGQGSYSIGCITIDPNNPNTVWVGSGENNNQRSVAYGDGVYKSTDNGQSWTNMGLKTSEHIGMIRVHPKNSNIVYVAAYGPLWSAGGERGLYKTIDGGKTWENILEISENTGINEVHLDPRNPNVIYATAHQRRRHVFTYLSGGPESAIYKSTDGGKNFTKLKSGLPSGDVGRIALAISPVNPDVVYAMLEGHGTYRSLDRGESWSKQSDHETSGNYYVELFAHPTEVDVVYSMDTYGKVSKDGGKTFKNINESSKHVDNHCLWIDPNNTEHMIIGCDGGLYETFDEMKTWNWKENLPTIQFYRVAVDNAKPFYNVYGGTQDNNSLGGPSRTQYNRGIINEDWFVTNGGDGFESQIDPEDPNTVYAQAQYGWLVRFDKKSGESVMIQPQNGKDEPAYRWNWDAPLIISPHNHKTLYFAANVVFKSTDQGNSWEVISKDLSKQIDRNTLKIMGRNWGPEAIALHRSTSIFGNIVMLRENPLVEGELWAGTDDGRICVKRAGSDEWEIQETFTDIPEGTYVQDILLSKHNKTAVYTLFNNHKNGDFKPYILASSNSGKSWKSISNDLPERGSLYAIAEDHVSKDLLFVGTEFGVQFTLNKGKNWKALKGGLPTIAVRDLTIQERENDLVLATFGRGFYIMDDYSPLRALTDENLSKEGVIFPVKDGLFFNENNIGGISYKGNSYFNTPNPPVGATFYYHLKDAPESLKSKRVKANKDNENPKFPTVEELRKESLEKESFLVFVISNEEGQELRRITASAKKGMNKITWDGRWAMTSNSVRGKAPLTSLNGGPVALPGNYYVEGYLVVDEMPKIIFEKTNFTLNHLNNLTIPLSDEAAALAFQKSVDEVGKSLSMATDQLKELEEEVEKLQNIVRTVPQMPMETLGELRNLETQIAELKLVFYNDPIKQNLEMEQSSGLRGRYNNAYWGSMGSRAMPTQTLKNELTIVREELPKAQKKLDEIEKKTDEITSLLKSKGATIE